MYMNLGVCVGNLLYICLEVELLGCRVCICSTLGHTRLFPKVFIPVYIPAKSIWVLIASYPHQYKCDFSHSDRCNYWWWWIFFFVYVLSTWITSLVKLLWASCLFFCWSFVFSLLIFMKKQIDVWMVVWMDGEIRTLCCKYLLLFLILPFHFLNDVYW